jgi:hypothetical protein
MIIKATRKMLTKMAGLKAVFQYWIVRLAAVISKGLEAARLVPRPNAFSDAHG